MAKLKKIIGVLVFISLIAVFLDSALNKDIFVEKYGFSPLVLGAVLIVSEVFFNLGIAIMLVASGVFKMRFKDFINFDFSKTKPEGKAFFAGLVMNRLSALAPWSYILVEGWGKLPLAITGLIALELLVVITLAYGVIEITSKRIKVRRARPEDIKEIVEVEVKAWGKDGAATTDQFTSRINVFPEGVLVATSANKIAGVVVAEIIDYGITKEKGVSWKTITDSGLLKATHTLQGDALFGVDLSVDPAFQGKGVGSELLVNIGKILVRRNLKFAVLGARMPDYHKHNSEMSADDYAKWRDENGLLIDPELRFYEKNGLKIGRVIPKYFPDKDSLDFGVLCIWKNPLYGANKLLRMVVSHFLKHVIKL